MRAPKIIDVIVHTDGYGFKHVNVIVDQPIKIIYERRGDFFFGQHGYFYNFRAIRHGSREAFGGAAFDMTLTDGTIFRCHGQVWDVGSPPELHGKLKSIGVATIEQLRKCYVFFGSAIKLDALNEWLSNNEPSTDYYKYDEERKWWRDVLPTLRIVRNRRRAKFLRQRGESIKYEPRVRAWTWSRVQA